MNWVIIVLVFLGVPFILTQQQQQRKGCTIFSNTPVEWEVKEGSSNMTIHIFEYPGTQWVAIGFNNKTQKEVMDGAIIFMYFEDELNEYRGIGNDKPVWVRKLEHTNSHPRNPLSANKVTFEVPLEGQIWNRDEEIYLLFAENTHRKPNSATDFEQHTYAAKKLINFVNVPIEGRRCGIAFINYWGHNNFALLSIVLVILIVLFLACIILRKRQPLKSRGMVPSVIILAQILATIQVFTESGDIVPMEFQQKYGCIATYLLLRTSRTIIPVVIVIHTLRFLLILNLNNMKSLFCQKNYTGTGTAKIKILKVLTAPWFSIVVLIGFCAVWTLICLIELSIYGFDCNRIVTGQFTNTLMAIIAATFWIIGGVILLYDIIMNYKLKCNLIKYFIRNDVYSYRVEVFMAFGVATLLIVYGVTNVFVEIIIPLSTIIYTILLWCLTLNMAVFPLGLTIIWTIKKFYKKYNPQINEEENHGMVEKYMADDGLRPLIVEFAKQEWSLENIMIWDDIERFKKLKKNSGVALKDTENERLAMAKEIYDKYLRGDEAIFQVNIDRPPCLRVLAKIKEGDISDDSFDEVLNAVKLNLCDTLARFSLSAAYKEYQRSVKQRRELMKKSGIFSVNKDL